MSIETLGPLVSDRGHGARTLLPGKALEPGDQPFNKGGLVAPLPSLFLNELANLDRSGTLHGPIRRFCFIINEVIAFSRS